MATPTATPAENITEKPTNDMVNKFNTLNDQDHYYKL